MNLYNKKLFIFDLDGTLVDTAPDFRNSLNYMLSEMGQPLVSLEEIRKYVGYGARELIKRTAVAKKMSTNNSKINEMLRVFLLHYTHNIDDDSVLFDNVLNVLKFLKKKDVKLAVCTNKMEKLSLMLLEKLEVLTYFDYLVGGDTFKKSKPDPMPLFEICKYLSLKTDDAIMIGDSVTDLNAGHRANMPVVLVEYGYSDNKDIYNDADLVINNFSQLKDLFT